mgnify:CR=1 FL=1
MTTERRRFIRPEALNLLDYLVVDDQGRQGEYSMARTLNVSKGGILMETHRQLPLGGPQVADRLHHRQPARRAIAGKDADADIVDPHPLVGFAAAGQRVDHGMHQHVGVRMTEQAALVRNIDAADDQFAPFDQRVDVAALSDADHACRPWRMSSASARSSCSAAACPTSRTRLR